MKPLLGTLVGLGLLAACSGSGVPASAPAASAPAKPAASRPAGISAAPSAAGKLEPLKMAYGAAVL
ncbi:MAG TPA: hypothetical protein VF157_00755, partial [Chloroflexota bacterium]